MSLDGQVAIVTGASRGIGEYIAQYLARAGAKVVVAARTEEVVDKRLPGTIHSVTKEINDAGGDAFAVRTDMRDNESIQACVDETVKHYGKLTIVVNNAAILVPGDLKTVLDRHIELMWGIDLRGPVILQKYALPHLLEAGEGHILNISSGVAKFPGPGPYTKGGTGGIFYGMVKAGLERFSQGLAMDLQGDNISVNVLEPGGRIRTPGNIWAENDPDNPTLEFEPSDDMGKASVWMCEQPPQQYTGNIVNAIELCKEQGL